MKRILIQFSFFVALLALSVSCIEDIDQTRIFKGDPLVEFNSPVSNANFTRLTNAGAGVISEQVNLIAPQFSSDQTITFRVDSELTTAEAGVHYNLGSNGSFVIPANSSFGSAQVEILGTAIPAGTTRLLVLELVGNDVIKPSENHKRVRISIRP
ncbi:DUF4843 domain-containing protein [Belliella sp. R4-6]|uniref:DUF4843 domain-containing protein n=1 Tax=Belliella alkalica TaxID=1730871 RepID=A0ABS9VED9_9BACT|nr:DUF4843 domain-containing protein [Belliella alkalica]MCH7414814.1 DUF4843 domain-containing protein [Belliella alkalica]